MVAMQGTSTSGDKPSLSADEAEAAADAFRPAWDMEDTAVDAPAVVVPPVGPSPASPSGAIVGSPVIAGGGPAAHLVPPAHTLSYEDKPVTPTPSVAAVPVPSPVQAPALGQTSAQSPPPAAAAPRVSVSTKNTMLGMSPATQAAIVAAAQTFPPPVAAPPSSPMRAPAVSSEALDSASVIEVVPKASSAAPSVARASIAPAPPVPPPAASPSFIAEPMPAAPARREPIPFAATDPFRSTPASALESDDDLPVKKKSSTLWFALGGVAAIGLGLFFALGGEEQRPAPRPSTQLGAAPRPTNDIPPPPPKEELAPPPTAPTAAATAVTQPATPVRTADPLVHAGKTEPPPRPDPPKPAVARAPTPIPRPAAPPAATPKTAPKPTGGGIVRDSPF